jgi:hypothetical protein
MAENRPSGYRRRTADERAQTQKNAASGRKRRFHIHDT